MSSTEVRDPIVPKRRRKAGGARQRRALLHLKHEHEHEDDRYQYEELTAAIREGRGYAENVT
jgi:hypothetical protein